MSRHYENKAMPPVDPKPYRDWYYDLRVAEYAYAEYRKRLDDTPAIVESIKDRSLDPSGTQQAYR